MNTTTKETAMTTQMNEAIERVMGAINGEHTSVWKFIGGLEDWEGVETPEAKATCMLAQALRQWDYYRDMAHEAYQNIVKEAGFRISDIENNISVSYDLDASRVNEYNAKAATQVECVRTAAYIIGLDNEAIKQLFAIVTALQFGTAK